MNGNRPACPTEGLHNGLSDDIWKLMTACWHEKAEQRPTASQIVNRLEHIIGVPHDVLDEQTWDMSFMLDVRRELEKHPFCPPRLKNVDPSHLLARTSLKYLVSQQFLGL